MYRFKTSDDDDILYMQGNKRRSKRNSSSTHCNTDSLDTRTVATSDIPSKVDAVVCENRTIVLEDIPSPLVRANRHNRLLPAASPATRPLQQSQCRPVLQSDTRVESQGQEWERGLKCDNQRKGRACKRVFQRVRECQKALEFPFQVLHSLYHLGCDQHYCAWWRARGRERVERATECLRTSKA